MLKKNKSRIIISSIIILLPMIFGLIMWDKLPDTMTTHWGADGNADGFSGKVFAVFGLPAITLILHFVCLLFTLFDKKQKEQNPKALGMIFWILPVVSLFTNGIMYRTAFGKEFDLAVFVPALLGVMFIFIGNYLPKVKQIQQDKERLEKLQKRIQKEQVKYEPARHISKTLNEIDSMGQKTITGKMAISKEDYSQLTALAKEGITSRAEIKKFEQSATYYRQKYMDSANALERMKTKYNELKEKCRPFLEALEHFPEVAKLFTEKVKQLFSFKEAQERAEKEAREKERQERIKARRNKRGMER